MKKNKVPINIHLINAVIVIVQQTKLYTSLLGPKKAWIEEGLKLGIEGVSSLNRLTDEALSE